MRVPSTYLSGISMRKETSPLTFKWKAQHHLRCVNALNDKFRTEVTAKQVDRHFRSFKERWKWIKQAMRRSCYGFDAALIFFNIDKSEKLPSKLGAVKYNYLTHSIEFFPLLEELFGKLAHADGSLAIDVNDASDNDESEDGNNKENYTSTAEQGLSDSDIIARSSLSERISSSVKLKHVRSLARKTSKKIWMGKSGLARVSDNDVVASIVSLAKTVTTAAAANADLNANLWKRIEYLPLTASDKIELAIFLCKLNQADFHGFLNYASDSTFNTWVMEHFERKYTNNDDAADASSA